MAETQEVRDKVVLVGLNSPVLKQEENADEDTMEELSALVETAGGETVGIVLQNRPSPDPRTFIGEGKVAEVQLYCENTGATMVIFDNDLSPSQMRVLTQLLGVQVLDRAALILDIFAQRARTREGRLQVELAQYQYLLPRLLGMWTHLERQEGAIGTRGPGETQLETDRRHIRRKIQKLREELELALYSSDGRCMVFHTAVLAPKTTRTTQGVNVMALKPKRTVTQVLPLAETAIVNAARYRARSLPVAGAILREEDRGEKQLSLLE